jgi:cytochrome P450
MRPVRHVKPAGMPETVAAGHHMLTSLPGPHLTRDRLRGLDLVDHLLDVADAHPAPLVAHAVESFFAPHMGTVGCVGVRGPEAVRQVLTDSTDYGPLQPDTADLPPDVRSMSRGVFTFDGPPHVHQRSALRELIALDDRAVGVVRQAARRAAGEWSRLPLDLTTASRTTARDVLGVVLFGPGEPGRAIARGVQRVVDGRRARRLATTPVERRDARHRTVDASRSLASMLARWLVTDDRQGLLAGLGDDVADDEGAALAVAHATALCAAATEPAAATLAWTVLALTQRLDLQEAIADERTDGPAVAPVSDLLDRVLLETQRLVPSSAIVTRATLRPVEVAGHVLPARCEVMVSSLLAHRDPSVFPDPRRFDPDRWVGSRPGPFAFFPFGAGVRGCLGATVARVVLRATLAELLATGTVSLAFDTKVGWQMPDALVPGPGIPVVVTAAPAPEPGRVEGPLTRLVDFVPTGAIRP